MGWVVNASLSVITVVASVRPQTLGATLKSRIFNMWLLVLQERNMQKKWYWQRRKMLKCTPDSLGGRWGMWRKWGNSLLFSGGSQGVAHFTRMRSAPLKGYGLASACADNTELIYVKDDTTKTIETSVCSNPSQSTISNKQAGRNFQRKLTRKKMMGDPTFWDKGGNGRSWYFKALCWDLEKPSV